MYTLTGAITVAIREAGPRGTRIVYKAWHNLATFESPVSYGVASTLPTFGIRAGNVQNGVFIVNQGFLSEKSKIARRFEKGEL